MSFLNFTVMGLFGSDEENTEEVTLGLSDEKESSEKNSDSENSPEVGTVDFGGSEDESDDSGNLKDEVSRLDSVRENVDTGSTGSGNTGSESADLEDIRDQNQEIIDKLDKVLSRL